ncbi:Homeodomain-like protein [Tribonema minus]|uniref:Homeodomain-like protein n=1 Tax=Tribonema minus TaxID=303371 RepID=A0A835YTC6_9STRA|nr:Homeodomain-like protein [Tribonema minus]
MLKALSSVARASAHPCRNLTLVLTLTLTLTLTLQKADKHITPELCHKRWDTIVRNPVVKGPWSSEEDRIVRELVARHGSGGTCWMLMNKKGLPQRTAKQIRERWLNHLAPDINKDPWTQEEDLVLCAAHRHFGGSYAEFARLLLPGRPENNIKNRLNKLLASDPVHCWLEVRV